MDDDFSLSELKIIGHALIEEYISLKPRRKKNNRDHAYKKLREKLGAMYGTHHFSKMKTREEALRACAALRKMIRRRKSDIEYRKYNVFWRPGDK